MTFYSLSWSLEMRLSDTGMCGSIERATNSMAMAKVFAHGQHGATFVAEFAAERGRKTRKVITIPLTDRLFARRAGT